MAHPKQGPTDPGKRGISYAAPIDPACWIIGLSAFGSFLLELAPEIILFHHDFGRPGFQSLGWKNTRAAAFRKRPATLSPAIYEQFTLFRWSNGFRAFSVATIRGVFVLKRGSVTHRILPV